MSEKLDYYFNSAMKEHASSSEEVAKVILKAITSEDPKLRMLPMMMLMLMLPHDITNNKEHVRLSFKKIIMQNF
jgi:hypothetical protein